MLHRVFFGNDGGVLYSNNITQPTGVYTTPTKDYGLNVTRFYCVGMNPTAASNYFLAGAQKDGSQRFNGASVGIDTTTEASGGNGVFLI